jgi:hypothetical protein
MEFALDVEVEMTYRTLAVALAERSCLYAAEAPFHDLTQDRSAWPTEILGQVIHFLPRRRLKAGIHADARARVMRPLSWR